MSELGQSAANASISWLNRRERIETTIYAVEGNYNDCISWLNRRERIETLLRCQKAFSWVVSPGLTAGSGLKQNIDYDTFARSSISWLNRRERIETLKQHNLPPLRIRISWLNRRERIETFRC